jgi:hypothetical protein
MSCSGSLLDGGNAPDALASTISIYVAVEDADGHYERARTAGARIKALCRQRHNVLYADILSYADVEMGVLARASESPVGTRLHP